MDENQKEIPSWEVSEIVISLSKFLERGKIPFCIVGGFSLGFYDAGRVTKDVDFKISFPASSWANLHKTLQKESRISDLHVHYISDPNIPDILRMRWEEYPIDFLVANTDYQIEVIKRAKIFSFFKIPIPIATPEDLIILKLIADRPHDRSDVELLFQKIKKLDLRYIRKWCRIWEVEKRLDKFLSKRKTLQKKKKK